MLPLALEVTLLLGVEESSVSLVLPPPVPPSCPSLDGGSSRIGVAQLYAPRAPSAATATGFLNQRLDIGLSRLPYPARV